MEMSTKSYPMISLTACHVVHDTVELSDGLPPVNGTVHIFVPSGKLRLNRLFYSRKRLILYGRNSSLSKVMKSCFEWKRLEIEGKKIKKGGGDKE